MKSKFASLKQLTNAIEGGPLTWKERNRELSPEERDYIPLVTEQVRRGSMDELPRLSWLAPLRKAA